VIDQLGNFIHALSGALLPVQVCEHFSDLAEKFGFPESVIIALLEPRTSQPVAYWRTTGDVEAYARNNPAAQNPLAQYAFAVDVPFDVPTACAALGYRESDVRRVLYPAVRDKHIVVFPVHRHGRFAMYAGCAGDNPEDTPNTRALLHAAAHATYDMMTALAPNMDLTQREAACLASIARGKSYKETGQLLGIAERTVRADVASAKRKLKAETQSGVIAKAIGPVSLRERPEARHEPEDPRGGTSTMRDSVRSRR
jgi:DNA-binding CsgD family transcriptional regulator